MSSTSAVETSIQAVSAGTTVGAGAWSASRRGGWVTGNILALRFEGAAVAPTKVYWTGCSCARGAFMKTCILCRYGVTVRPKIDRYGRNVVIWLHSMWVM